MKLSRLVQAVAAAALLSGAFSGNAVANDAYPSRPVTLSVGYAPGGIADRTTRQVAKVLAEQLKQTVVVENKTGADGRIQMQAVARSAPDGYTLGLMDSSLVASALMYTSSSRVDPLKDFTPIMYLGEMANAIVVTPSLKVNTLQEFVSHAKAHPGKLNYASTATSTLLAAEVFKHVAGMDVVNVAYRGAAQATPALIAGEVHLLVSAAGPLVPLIKGGQVTALAVTGAQRSALLPDVPTTAEAGVPGMAYVNWYCIVGPAGMPKDMVDRLNADLRTVLADPSTTAQFAEMGIVPRPGSPADLTSVLKSELARLDKVVTAARLKVD